MDLLLDSVSKSFGDVAAVSGVSIRADDGEAVAILGPSGSGKTTILRLIAGLEEPSSGNVLFDGREAQKDDPRDVTMLFSDNRLIPTISTRSNIGFPLTVRSTPEPERTERVEAEASAMGIESLLERMPATLSAGQANLVHLAKAMVRAPGLFLIDEPMGDLHPNLRRAMRTELRNIQTGYRATAVYATNDQEDAMILADRIVVIEGGRVRQVGTPAEIYSRPIDLFVATFLGSPAMSILTGERSAGGIVVGDLQLSVPRGLGAGEYLIGVRPEHVVTASKGLRATIEKVQFVGSNSYAHAETAGGALTVRCGDDQLSKDDVVYVDFSEFHVFDSQTELAVHHRTARRHL